MKTLHTLRKAFTMVEIVFVIVVLGIVASIGAEIIAQAYESYIVQRAQYKSNTKTELALNQIGNRLRYAIQNTVVARASLTATATAIESVTDADLKVLQWVAYDGDSFEAISSDSDRKPGWSGFCDVMASGGSTISTPGSNLGLANTIISNLGGSLADATLYFSSGETELAVSGGSGESISLDSTLTTGDTITERYRLAWTSYALEVDDNKDLILHYNFSPTVGTAINGSSQLLLHNVSNFRFKSSGGAFRIKICIEEQIGANSDQTVHSCKEKVIF